MTRLKRFIKGRIRRLFRIEFTVKLYLLGGIFWSVLGFLLSLGSELMLFSPPLIAGFLDYGHLKPLSSLVLLFGAFLSFLTGLAYSILRKQIEIKAPAALLAFICFKLHHLGLALGIVGIFLGLNKGRILGEMPWIADNIFALSLLGFPVILGFGFAGKRLKDPSLLLIFLSLIGALFYYALGNFNLPTGLFTSTSLFAGIQDMALQEIYLGGLLYFVILSGLFGLLYYYVPLYYRSELYSSSIAVFVSMVLLFLTPLASMAGLVHSFAPSWLQSLGIFSSMALNFAMMSGGLNAKYSITRSSKSYRSDSLGLMLRAGIFFLVLTALARALLAPRFMQAYFAYGSFAVGDPIFNVKTYALLLVFPMGLLALQNITGEAYSKRLLNWLAFFWIFGAFLFYIGNLGADLAQYSKASALDPEGQDLLVQNWRDVFFSAKLFTGDALWAQYLFSFRGLALSGSFLITLGLLCTALYVFICIFVDRSQAVYEMPDLEFREKE